MVRGERDRNAPYWNCFEEIVEASAERNTAGFPLACGLRGQEGA